MMHGVLAAGDTYEQQFLRFTSNGYDPRVVYVFDWNSIGLGANNEVLLDKFIDDILEKTGQTQVNLVGHSAGGGLGYGYCENASRAAKIAHYVKRPYRPAAQAGHRISFLEIGKKPE